MQTTLRESLPDAASLAAEAAVPGTPGHHDELHGALTNTAEPPAAVAPLWGRFFDTVGTAGWHDFATRQARVQRRVREDGATYNVYADGGNGAHSWPLKLLPFLIDEPEWAHIERGVRQRARLLNTVLADIYGEQKLLQEGLLPPSLIYGHPQYLRPMHGVKPVGGTWLHVLAVDLARAPDGHWWVVGYRTQAPSGLGYLLENRLVVAQQFSDAFRELRVQRVAGAFQALMDGLLRASPARERSRVALLTPGPRNETYFEHVFLARYLGLSLVEGSDLTVRDQRLYLKTMHGLERVHVLLRRVDDEWLDPLELRSDSALGVPGLLQAMRAGEVVVANAPGAGVLESPGLRGFWPAVARRLLGENLVLPATTSWWCGEETVWRANRAKLADYVVAPTFPGHASARGFEPVLAGSLAPEALKALEARIDADPAAYTLLARVRPSEMPVWDEGQLAPRTAVVRVYAVADGSGDWRVLPGGLTRVGSSSSGSSGTDAYLSMQRGSASADTWVLTSGNVDAISLLPRPLAPSDLVGWHRAITSRAAENLFWLGRYTERAENTVRLARLTLEGLTSAAPATLGVLHRLCIRHGLIGLGVPAPVQTDSATSLHAARLFERTLVRSLADLQGSTSVAYNLRSLKQCAEALRERLSPEHWTLIDQVGEQFSREMLGVLANAETSEPLSDVLAVLGRVTTQLSAITGAQTDRMTRDDGWRLLSVGRMVERLDMLAHALGLGFEAGLPELDDGFALLLGLFDSTITYRAQFQARREVPPLLHLLVLDPDNPRSLAWVARTMRERLRKLARHDPTWVDSVIRPLPVPEHWSLEVLSARDEKGGYAALMVALDECSRAAQTLSHELSRRLFSHVGPAERTVWQ
ncbi:MAG: circularly permuted type 2 ATP-grasp protein [Leptothrix sp. (in: b-proteobacteria)]